MKISVLILSTAAFLLAIGGCVRADSYVDQALADPDMGVDEETYKDILTASNERELWGGGGGWGGRGGWGDSSSDSDSDDGGSDSDSDSGKYQSSHPPIVRLMYDVHVFHSSSPSHINTLRLLLDALLTNYNRQAATRAVTPTVALTVALAAIQAATLAATTPVSFRLCYFTANNRVHQRWAEQ